MIKKNLIVKVTEKTPAGEDHLYTLESVSDRSKILMKSGAPEVLLSDISELQEVIKAIQDFGIANPSPVEDTSKVVATPEGELVMSFGDLAE